MATSKKTKKIQKEWEAWLKERPQERPKIEVRFEPWFEVSSVILVVSATILTLLMSLDVLVSLGFIEVV